MSTPSNPFGKRLALAFTVINLFVLMVVGLALHHSYRLHYRQAEVSTRNLAQTLENSLTGTIKQHDVALLSVIDEFSRQQADGGIHAPTLNAYVDKVHSRLPKLNGLRIADEQGYFTWGTTVDPVLKTNISDRDYFIQQRDNRNTGLFISRPVISRVDKHWAVAFSRRLNHPDGRFAGVANTSVSLEEFVKTFSALDVGRAGVIALRDANLAVVARYPEPDGIGSTVGNKSVSRSLRELVDSGQDSGTYTDSSGLDHIDRVFSYRRLGDYPLYIIVGLASRDFLIGWWDELHKALILIASFILISLLASWQIYRAWKCQAAAMTALRVSENRLVEQNTQLAEARDQAMEAIRTKSLFLAGISHDLKHPLNALGLYLGYLKTQHSESTAASGVARTMPGMEQALGSMSGLLSRLLDLSRLEAGEYSPHWEEVSVKALFQGCAAQFGSLAAGKRLRLRFRPCNGCIRGDSSLLQSILDNLVGNALRYTERGGVVVGMRKRYGRWVLQVTDSGVGIPEERIPLLFEAYRRFDDTQRDVEGYGLGLALVKKQCELLGYRIEVKSRVGRGSVFSVVIG